MAVVEQVGGGSISSTSCPHVKVSLGETLDPWQHGSSLLSVCQCVCEWVNERQNCKALWIEALYKFFKTTALMDDSFLSWWQRYFQKEHATTVALHASHSPQSKTASETRYAWRRLWHCLKQWWHSPFTIFLLETVESIYSYTNSKHMKSEMWKNTLM